MRDKRFATNAQDVNISLMLIHNVFEDTVLYNQGIVKDTFKGCRTNCV